jgi:hypothetical protein
MVDRHLSLNLKTRSTRTLCSGTYLAVKYSVGLQEIFNSRLCSQEENYFLHLWTGLISQSAWTIRPRLGWFMRYIKLWHIFLDIVTGYVLLKKIMNYYTKWFLSLDILLFLIQITRFERPCYLYYVKDLFI